MALKKTFEFYKQLKSKNSNKFLELIKELNINKKCINQWETIVYRIYIHEPNKETLLIEQFDGFFDLEDITPDTLSKRLINEEEYWSLPNGITE